MMKTVPDPLPQALADLAALGKIRQRKMFGGVYIYCDDLFIATAHDATLYFKANAHTAPDFVARCLPPVQFSEAMGRCLASVLPSARGGVFGRRSNAFLG